MQVNRENSAYVVIVVVKQSKVCYASTRLSLAAHSVVPSGAIISAYIRDACCQTQQFELVSQSVDS